VCVCVCGNTDKCTYTAMQCSFLNAQFVELLQCKFHKDQIGTHDSVTMDLTPGDQNCPRDHI
jgi:hypothetical protein